VVRGARVPDSSGQRASGRNWENSVAKRQLKPSRAPQVRAPLRGPSLDLEAKFRAEEALYGPNVVTSLPD
jgi:hypothetical protein